MIDSHYQVEGDTVKAQITFVPRLDDTELRCEASNEAIDEPRSRTIKIAVDIQTSDEQEDSSVSPELSADDSSNQVIAQVSRNEVNAEKIQCCIMLLVGRFWTQVSTRRLCNCFSTICIVK